MHLRRFLANIEIKLADIACRPGARLVEHVPNSVRNKSIVDTYYDAYLRKVHMKMTNIVCWSLESNSLAEQCSATVCYKRIILHTYLKCNVQFPLGVSYRNKRGNTASTFCFELIVILARNSPRSRFLLMVLICDTFMTPVTF